MKKTAVERSLASLVEDGLVNKKEYGKAKIFLLRQDTLDLPDDIESASTDAQLHDLTSQLQTLSQELSQKRERIAHLKSQYTLDDAMQRLTKLREDLETKQERRQRLGDGSALMSKQDKLQLDMGYFRVRAAWKKYLKLVRDIVDQIAEASGKKRGELYEEIGIETDEDANVNLMDMPEIDNPMKPKRPGSAGGAAFQAQRSINAKRQRQS